MVFKFGPLIKAVFPNREKRKLRVARAKERAATRQHIRRATSVIKEVVKEPDELPLGEDMPAVKELLNNGTQSP